MHKHDFCGEQSIYTRAILANKKICMHDFFVGGGGTWGHGEFVGGGGTYPQAPPPLPVATPCWHVILMLFKMLKERLL